MIWEIVLATAAGGFLMGILIVVCSDYYQYWDLQRRLREERKEK